MTINELLDEAAEKLGGASDTKLGKELGAYQQKIYDWRNSKGEPDKYACWRLAEITGRDLYEIIAIIEADREKRPEVKAFFEKILSSGAYRKVAVAGLAAGVLFSPFGSGDASANASSKAHSSTRTVFIM